MILLKRLKIIKITKDTYVEYLYTRYIWDNYSH